jgi:hypothetical protein
MQTHSAVEGHTMRKAKAAIETPVESAISARFADGEINHLEKILRSSYRDDIGVESQPYWRRRIEHLRAEPLLLPQQRARLDSLLVGLTAT